jgi:hypothetical protein
MRISLINASTTYPLAGQSGVSERVHSSASGLRMEPEVEIDSWTIINGRHAGFQDNGNMRWRVSFQTSRTFATVQAAELYALGYDALTPRTGTLKMECINGGSVSSRQMLNAVVPPPARNLVGCTLYLSYSITGGEIIPGESITLGANTLWSWTLQEWQTVTNQWQTL